MRHRTAVARLLRRLAGVHPELARDRLARLNRLTGEVRDLERRIERVVAGHPLRALPGAGPLVTAKLIGEVSRAGSCVRAWEKAMHHSARLSWRLPPRFRRIRLTCPELAGMGATPASMANASAERNREMSPTSPMSLAATSGPAPGSVRSG